MGPRLLSRGETLLASRTLSRLASFNGAAASQPRRGVSEADNIVVGSVLQWGRGFSAAERMRFATRKATLWLASMGPRLLSRGERNADNRLDSLWLLQWGRGFSAAERKSIYFVDGEECSASMGPRLLSRGEHLSPVYLLWQ